MLLILFVESKAPKLLFESSLFQKKNQVFGQYLPTLFSCGRSKNYDLELLALVPHSSFELFHRNKSCRFFYSPNIQKQLLRSREAVPRNRPNKLSSFAFISRGLTNLMPFHWHSLQNKKFTFLVLNETSLSSSLYDISGATRATSQSKQQRRKSQRNHKVLR